MKRTKKKTLKVILFSLGILVALVVLACVSIRVIAPAIIRTNHKIGESGIDRMEKVEIGGIQQALYFRGQDINNPVILYLHGGPGFSEMGFLHMFQYEWEDDFTVVQWDQRNAGKTYFANDPEAVLQTMSGERVLGDVHEVTAYVKQQLNKDKIIIMGHSWGTVLGTMAVQTYPEDYSAYIAVGQIVNMADNERVGYETVLEAARAAEDQKDVEALEALAPYPPEGYSDMTQEKLEALRAYQMKYKLASGGADFTMIFNGLMSPHYNWDDMQYYMNVDHEHYQGDVMRFEWDKYDARNYGLDYKIPVYYMMGENDYQVPYTLAKEFFEEISAPDKQFYTIPNASHMTMVDNKAEFDRVLLEEIRPKIR